MMMSCAIPPLLMASVASLCVLVVRTRRIYRVQPWNAKLKELYAAAMDKNLAEWVQDRFKDVSPHTRHNRFFFWGVFCSPFYEIDGADVLRLDVCVV